MTSHHISENVPLVAIIISIQFINTSAVLVVKLILVCKEIGQITCQHTLRRYTGIKEITLVDIIINEHL